MDWRKEWRSNIWTVLWSTDSGWPCIFMPVVCAIRSRCVLFGLAQALAKVIVIQATDEWTTLYDLLWSFHCSSTDTILLSIYTTPQLNPGGRLCWVDIGVWRYWGDKFLPKQVRLFEDDAKCRAAKPFCLSLKQSELVKPSPILRHVALSDIHTSLLHLLLSVVTLIHTTQSLVQHHHFLPKGHFLSHRNKDVLGPGYSPSYESCCVCLFI